MAIVNGILKQIAIERTRREVEQEINECMQKLRISLLDIEETEIHRKHIYKETSTYFHKIRRTFENAYTNELVSLYKESPYSILSKPSKTQKIDCIKPMEGAAFNYVLAWYESYSKGRIIKFRGYNTYKEAANKIIKLIAEDNINIKDMFLLEEVNLVLDIEAIIECD